MPRRPSGAALVAGFAAALALGAAGFYLAYRELNAFLIGGEEWGIGRGMLGVALLGLAVAALARVVLRL